MKIVRRGENVKDVWRIIMANHRTPRNTWGDLNAHDRLAARRRSGACIELLDRYGAGLIDQASRAS